MGKIVICSFCGGEFDDTLPKCPYCDSTNIKGTELEYMETLEDVREDMGELDSAPLEELQDTVKKQGRFLKKIIVLILAVVAVVTLIVVIVNHGDKKDFKSEYLWQQKYFPQLSQLYDSEEYDAMMKLGVQAKNENPSATLQTWEHYIFYEAYARAKLYTSLILLRDEGYLSENEYNLLFRSAWDLVCLEEFDRAEFTEKEWETLAPYIELAREALTSDWGLTDGEYQEFLQMAERNYHIVPYDSCDEYVKQWLKEQE